RHHGLGHAPLPGDPGNNSRLMVVVLRRQQGHFLRGALPGSRISRLESLPRLGPKQDGGYGRDNQQGGANAAAEINKVLSRNEGRLSHEYGWQAKNGWHALSLRRAWSVKESPVCPRPSQSLRACHPNVSVLDFHLRLDRLNLQRR